jgi:hypothetical protein
MMKRLLFSFVLIFPRLILPQIAINEVMFDPLGPETTDEFVEIYNRSDCDTVDLSGWRFGDDSGLDPIVDAGQGLLFSPRQYAVILDPDYFKHSSTYDSLIPNTALILTVGGSTLGNAGLSNSRSETLILLNDRGETVAHYSYSIGNKPGYSDEKINLSGTDAADNWADSRIPMGTPGRANSVCQAVMPANAEILVQPDPFSPDHDGFEDELTVAFRLPWPDGNVSLRVFDLNGRMVKNLIPGLRCGREGVASWNGCDDSGRGVSMGIYIILLEGLNAIAGETVCTKRAVVLASPL